MKYPLAFYFFEAMLLRRIEYLPEESHSWQAFFCQASENDLERYVLSGRLLAKYSISSGMADQSPYYAGWWYCPKAVWIAPIIADSSRPDAKRAIIAGLHLIHRSGAQQSVLIILDTVGAAQQARGLVGRVR